MVAGVNAAAARIGSNVIMSFLERRAVSMCRAIAECCAYFATIRFTDAEMPPRSTSGV